MAPDLIFAIGLVAANGFFVATEFAIARLRPTQVEEFERAGRPGANSVRHAVEHIDAYLAACQLGITIASLGLGVLGEPAFEELLHPILGDGAAIGGFALSAVLAFAIITVLHVVELDDPHEATIGGHVVEELGRVPEPGETLELDGLSIEVVESDGPLVRSLRLRPLP